MKLIAFVFIVAIAMIATRADDDNSPCFCPDHLAPVCGANGVTYATACEAACAKVEVAHEGRCKNDDLKET